MVNIQVLENLARKRTEALVLPDVLSGLQLCSPSQLFLSRLL